MRGNPKYKLNEYVRFTVGDVIKNGTIYIIDKYGTFFDDNDVSYDIMVAEENCLYKHIREDFVSKISK